MSNRKDYSEVSSKMRDDVTEVENLINERLASIWTDDTERDYYMRIDRLTLSDKRLWIVYSLLDHSIIKTARHFKCDRGTVRQAIANIKTQLGYDLP